MGRQGRVRPARRADRNRLPAGQSGRRGRRGRRVSARRGRRAAIAVARERSGTQFDPDVVDVFCEQAPLIFADLDAASSWELVIDSEPSLASTVAGEELDDALTAIGEFAELKSPWLMGHSRGVADLATDAARGSGPAGIGCDAASPRGIRARHRTSRCIECRVGQGRRAHAVRARAGSAASLPDRAHAVVLRCTAPLGAIAGQAGERRADVVDQDVDLPVPVQGGRR